LKTKVLQCAMGLDIGGAETHVVALAKGLKARGHDVFVASNGGVFEKGLHDLGIETVDIPMHSKKPLYVIKSLLKLRRVIKTFKPDVVHAHARIPALYVSILSKFYKFKMVTTVHGTYKVNGLLKKITKWGKCVFSVSQDISHYLYENYDMGDCQVIETVNGIDLDVFKVDDKWSIKKPIVHVSRLDATTSQTAEYLIQYAIERQRRLIIFGHGTEFSRLEALAHAHDNIDMRGAVDNVQEGLLEGGLFVGISRAALEAMACNLPIILAGDYGMMGYLDPDKAESAKDHNFTSRHQTPLTYEGLREAIDGYYREDYQRDSSWARPFIKANYSQDKMVEDYIAGYTGGKKVFVIGYYGSHNLGDEFLLYETLELLEGHFDKANISALSYSVKETRQIHGVTSISRSDFFKIMKTIKASDLIIGGGGSMLQNVTSNRSLIYYLWLLNYSVKKRKKVAIIGNGIGPIKGQLQTRLCRKTLSKLDYIHLRDSQSYAWVKDKVQGRVDPGVDLALSASLNAKTDFGKKVYINLRMWKQTDYLVRLMTNFKSYLCKEGYEVIFIAMQEGNDDLAMESLGPVATFKKPDDLLEVLKDGDLVIGMRLHLLILAANYGIPFIGLSYDPKVAYYCNLFDQPYFDDFKSISLEQMIDTFNHQMTHLMDQHDHIQEVHKGLKAQNEGIDAFLSEIS